MRSVMNDIVEVRFNGPLSRLSVPSFRGSLSTASIPTPSATPGRFEPIRFSFPQNRILSIVGIDHSGSATPTAGPKGCPCSKTHPIWELVCR